MGSGSAITEPEEILDDSRVGGKTLALCGTRLRVPGDSSGTSRMRLNPLWYGEAAGANRRDLLQQHLRMVYFARIHEQQCFGRLPENAWIVADAELINIEKVVGQDAKNSFARINDSAYELLAYRFFDEQKRYVIPLPLPCIRWPDQWQSLANFLDRSASEISVIPFLAKVAEFTLDLAVKACAPVEIPEGRILFSGDEVFLNCSDLAFGPLTRRLVPSMSGTDDVASYGAEALRALILRVAEKTAGRQLLDEILSHDSSEFSGIKRIEEIRDAFAVAIGKNRTNGKLATLYVDTANMLRVGEYTEWTDCTFRWRGFIRDLESAKLLPKGVQSIEHRIVFIVRTNDPVRFPRFFKSVDESRCAVRSRQQGGVSGDQLDDIELVNWVRSDIEAGRTAHALILTRDKKLLRDHFPDSARYPVTPLNPDQSPVLIRLLEKGKKF